MSSETWLGIFSYLLVLFFFLFSKLETNITQEAIHLKHLMFVQKSIMLNDIQTAQIIRYGCIGYGIRISIKYGTVYNVKGNKGLALTLKNGKNYLIGTQKSDELNSVVEKIIL